MPRYSRSRRCATLLPVIIRKDAETDRLVGVLAKRIAERTGRDVVKVIVDLLQAADLAGLDADARLDLFRDRLAAKKRYCEAEGLDFDTYAEAQFDSEVSEATARIDRAMQER
jgi:hypothetical protein